MPSRMSRARPEASLVPESGSPPPFWRLLALLAREPALAWLGWALRQRGAAAWPAEERPPRSRSRPHLRASFLAAQDAAAGEGAPPAGGHRCVQNDCPLCRSRASLCLGPWPLEVLGAAERSAHPRIWKVYGRGLSRFLAFREEAGWPSAWPLPREQMTGFLTHHQHLPSPKILGYVAGLSYISRMFRFPDPLQDSVVSRRVIALHRRGDVHRRGCSPVSLDMLHCLVGVLDSVLATSYNRLMFRAAFVLAFCAALRPEEILAEDRDSLGPGLLQLRDFELSKDSIEIRLRVLGVGPERFALRLSRAGSPWMCPVLALSNYLEVRPRGEGPLFIHGNGEPLTKGQFLAVLDRTVRLLGLLPQEFGLHSLWLGGLITAVMRRIPEGVIFRLARWPNRGLPQAQ